MRRIGWPSAPLECHDTESLTSSSSTRPNESSAPARRSQLSSPCSSGLSAHSSSSVTTGLSFNTRRMWSRSVLVNENLLVEGRRVSILDSDLYRDVTDAGLCRWRPQRRSIGRLDVGRGGRDFSDIAFRLHVAQSHGVLLDPTQDFRDTAVLQLHAIIEKPAELAGTGCGQSLGCARQPSATRGAHCECGRPGRCLESLPVPARAA